MRCRECGEAYRLDWAQPAPGGSSSPGYFFWGALALFAVSAGLFLFGLSPWYWVTLVMGGVAASQVPIAYGDCAGHGPYDGSVCPACKTRNRSYWWSL